MDYLYQGSPEWPLVSAIASLVGIAMLFGKHVAAAALGFADLMVDDLRRASIKLARPWMACVILLALPAAYPALPLVRTLRGTAALDPEVEMARAEGYYEELIRSSGDRPSPRLATPPPGRKSFADSGLVDEVDDYRRRVLRPSLHAEWNGTSFRTNALGHRGPEISRRKPLGTFRMVVLGSSNSMGHGVEDEDSYARLLERWLSERAGGSRRVEVVNLSISGDSPTQRLTRLRVDVPPLEPDWILVDVTALDFSLEEQHLRWVTSRGIEAPFAFVSEAVVGTKVGPGDSPEEFHRKLGPSLRPLLDRTFEEWGVEARRIGTPLTVVLLPRADSKDASPGLFRFFRDAADHHRLNRIDLSGTFDRMILDDYRIAPWDHHPNPLGHRVIFARLRDGLLADPAFMVRLADHPPG